MSMAVSQNRELLKKLAACICFPLQDNLAGALSMEDATNVGPSLLFPSLEQRNPSAGPSLGRILKVWVRLGLASTCFCQDLLSDSPQLALVLPRLHLVLPRLNFKFPGTYFSIAKSKFSIAKTNSQNPRTFV